MQAHLSTRTIDLAANVVKPVSIDGEFFVVQAATGAFEFRVDSGEWVPGQVNVRRRLPNPERVSRVSFRSGSSIVVTVVHGVGNYDDNSVNVSGEVSVAEPAAVVVQTGVERITDNQTYSDCRRLSVFNVGAANITVQAATVAPGEFVALAIDRQNERLEPIAINATGSTALVSWTE